MRHPFVVDASATIKLLIEEPGSEHARRFFSHLADPEPPILYTPDLLYVECANTVWKYVSRYHYAPRSARAALHALAALALQAVPTQHLFQEALQLSIRTRISAYDACYLALAQQIACPLVTEDVDLIRRIRPHVKIPLHLLSEAVLHG